MHYYIYMYTFPNGKKYIGKTKRSMSQRQGSDWSGYKRCRLLWNAIQKYGTENIKTDILFEGTLTDEEASKLECFYIEKYKTNACKYKNPSYGYNLTDGGEGISGCVFTEERLEKLLAQLNEAIDKRRGKPLSDEHKQKLSESHKGLRKGYKLSEETKVKIGKANSLENISEETRKRKSLGHMKKVKATHIETGEVLIFNSRHEVAEYFGVRDSTVSRWINKTRNAPNNYIFENYSPTTTERVEVA